MKRLLLAALPLSILACAVPRLGWRVVAYRPPEEGVSPVTPDAVIRLSKAGIADDLILMKIRSDGVVARPTSEDLIRLKREGVADRVIQGLLGARVSTPDLRWIPTPYIVEYWPGWRYDDPFFDRYWGGWYWPAPEPPPAVETPAVPSSPKVPERGLP